MKGILLAGGSGTRPYPLTTSVSKQLLPVYDKPMIYYPLSTLIASGINEILIITTPDDLMSFKKLLKDGSQWGCKLEYEVQEKPNGIAESFIIAENFINNDNVALILGDNIFYFPSLGHVTKKSIINHGATIFAYHVSDPERYGVVEFSNSGRIISISEKPTKPKSNFAIPGFYFFDKNVVEFARKIKPSPRGELEITDIIQMYHKKEMLSVIKMDKGTAWLDTGTVNSLMEASQFVQVLENRQGLKVGCVEEQAYLMKYIDENELRTLSSSFNNKYGKYIKSILDE